MRVRLPRLMHLARYAFGFKLTPAGRLAVMAIFLSAVGSITVEVPIYQVFCGMIAIFGIVEMTGIFMRPKLHVSGWMPSKVAAGEQAVGFVSVENRGRLPACDIMCSVQGLPPALRHKDGAVMLRTLKRGEQATLPLSIHASLRGEYRLPEIRVHSTFPFNLMRFGKARLPSQKLTVLPAFTRLERVEIPLSQRYQSGGMAVEAQSGDSPEYVGNRDYVPGEPVRRLDFRAWARVGKPVVREYQEEFCSRVALVLDTHCPRRVRRSVASHPDLEAAVSLTAAIADALNERETHIDLFAAGPDLFLFQTSTGTTHFDTVLEILAAVEATRHNPFEKISPVIAESLESISVAVCVLLDWDESREELTRKIMESGCSLRVLLVRARPPARPFPEGENYSIVAPQEILSGAVECL